MNTEIGCIARANPYDVTLEEHMKAHVGLVHLGTDDHQALGRRSRRVLSRRHRARPGDSRGDVRPVPQPLDNVLPENVNRESWVNTDIAAAQAWLDNPTGSWNDGLDAAEKLANLLEGAQLIAMREPPTRTIGLLRQGAPNPAALREAISPLHRIAAAL